MSATGTFLSCPQEQQLIRAYAKKKNLNVSDPQQRQPVSRGTPLIYGQWIRYGGGNATLKKFFFYLLS